MTYSANLATTLRECLDAADPDTALQNFADRLPENDVVEAPHALVGFAAMLCAGALLHRGMPDRIAALLDHFNDAVAPAGGRIPGPFHCLSAPLIEAALALKHQDRTVRLVNACRKDMRVRGDGKMIAEPETAALMAHPKAGRYGPFHITSIWLLDRYEQASMLGPLDHRLEEVQHFHAGFAESALLAEAPLRAMPLIEQELDWYLANPAIDTSHFEFNAICVLAALGRFQEAMASSRQLIRRGYHLPWRFRLEAARQSEWTQEMRQNEWLEALAQTPAYQRFLDEDLPGPMLGDDPTINPLCVVKDGVWTGKKNKRCCISRRLIKPGDAVVRFRRLFNRASDGDLDMAAGDAFAASPWQNARLQFENDAIPVELLFPRNITRDAKLNDAPYIHAFAYDVARDPKAFDIARAVTLIADHAPPPIEYTWDRGGGSKRWEPAFPPFAGAGGYGDPVSLVWRIIKAGFRDALLKQISTLPQAKADKVLAMLGTFDDEQLLHAAASHFGVPDLPQAMTVVFKDRLSFEDHEALADFGSRNPRYRAGLAAAMRAYGLHLYSNSRPKADWFLAGLERYSMAGGSALLYLFIDHPEDEPVLKTVVERGWLPDRSRGSVDDYGNARHFYARTLLFHLARNKPEELHAWLTPQAEARWKDMAYGRETLRLINRYRSKRQRGR